jgi:hypothetical protein
LLRQRVTQPAVDWAVLPARGIKKAAAQMGNRFFGTPEGTRLHFLPLWAEEN